MTRQHVKEKVGGNVEVENVELMKKWHFSSEGFQHRRRQVFTQCILVKIRDGRFRRKQDRTQLECLVGPHGRLLEVVASPEDWQSDDVCQLRSRTILLRL